jgi:hypothetical protein
LQEIAKVRRTWKSLGFKPFGKDILVMDPGAFVQNLRGGHYDIATEVLSAHRLRIAFDDLAGEPAGQPLKRVFERYRCRTGGRGPVRWRGPAAGTITRWRCSIASWSRAGRACGC